MADEKRNAINVTITLPPEAVAIVAERAAQIVLAAEEQSLEPWLNVEQAAAHIACRKNRVYALVSARRIPHHKEGSRLLFLASELDEFVRNGGAKRP